MSYSQCSGRVSTLDNTEKSNAVNKKKREPQEKEQVEEMPKPLGWAHQDTGFIKGQVIGGEKINNKLRENVQRRNDSETVTGNYNGDCKDVVDGDDSDVKSFVLTKSYAVRLRQAEFRLKKRKKYVDQEEWNRAEATATKVVTEIMEQRHRLHCLV